MGVTLYDAYNVVVKDFAVVQPSFWAHLAAQCENVYYHNMYVNATNLNPGPVSNKFLSDLSRTVTNSTGHRTR